MSESQWTEVPQSVINLAQEVIQEHHHDLLEARIGFLFKTVTTMSHGKNVYAKAEKVSDKHKLLLDLDFLIWIDEYIWVTLDRDRQLALIDHELCHCCFDPVAQKASIIGHDVEEFCEIASRYGAWNKDLFKFKESLGSGLGKAIQDFQTTMLEHRGIVVAINPESASIERQF